MGTITFFVIIILFFVALIVTTIIFAVKKAATLTPMEIKKAGQGSLGFSPHSNTSMGLTDSFHIDNINN